jgi:hypothetical protein
MVKIDCFKINYANILIFEAEFNNPVYPVDAVDPGHLVLVVLSCCFILFILSTQSILNIL